MSIIATLVASAAPATQDLLVGARDATLVHVEPHVAVHATDPEKWVIAGIVTSPDQSTWSCNAFSTPDAGRTWTRSHFGVERCIDPWVTFGEGDTVWVTMTEIQAGHEDDERFALRVFISENAGASWSAIESDGRTFEHAMTMLHDNQVVVAARTTQENGDRVISAWNFAPRLGTLTPRFEFAPRESSDPMVTGLATLSVGGIGLSFTAGPDVRAGFVREARQNEPALITWRCGHGSGTFGGYPSLDSRVDHLYHVCVGPEYTGVWLNLSTDDGQTWGKSKRVDGDIKSQTRTPMVAAGDHSVLIAWYDRRNDPDGECQDVYATWATPNLSRIGAPFRVSDKTSCPNAPANGRAGSSSWNSGGDYGSLALIEPDLYLLVWADSRSGRFAFRYTVLGAPKDLTPR